MTAVWVMFWVVVAIILIVMIPTLIPRDAGSSRTRRRSGGFFDFGDIGGDGGGDGGGGGGD